MPKVIPKNTPIRDLITKFQNSKNTNAPIILNLLVSTREFLLHTSMQFHAVRQNNVITPKKIEDLLSRTAKSLKEVVSLSSDDGDAISVLHYCKSAIEDQLSMLYEKNDKLVEFVEKSELKRVLPRNSNF